VAAALRRDGVGPGDRVALLLDNRAEWPAVALGATAVGAVAAPTNTWVKARDLEYLLEHARPNVHLREVAPGVGPRRLVVVGGHVPPGATACADWVGSESAELRDDARPDDIALVIYTSGSTARPKAVPLTSGTSLIVQHLFAGFRVLFLLDDQ
jgi:fatty-acyl-CoA synthase